MLAPIKTKIAPRSISKTDQVSEIRRCSKDPAYFSKNYVYIKHKDKGSIKFNLWDFQEETLKAFQNNNMNIILKSRQLGITELMSLYILWFTLFQRDKNVVIVSKNRRQAAQIIKRIKYAYKKLPSWLKVSKMISDNVHTIEFENDSIIFADATTETAGRGEACSLFVVDEAAFIPEFEEMWSSVYPSINCVAGNTLILTDKGFKKIEDILPKNKISGDYFEFIENVWTKEGFNKTSHGYISSETDVLRIKTKHGLELDLTKDHSLYCLLETFPEMVKGSNLRVGDHLRIDSSMNIFGKETEMNGVKITKDFAYIMGGIIAEGWVSGNIGNGNAVIVSNSDNEFRDMFLNNSVIKQFHAQKDSIKLISCSRELCALLQYLGFNKSWKCYDKEIPHKIFEWNKELLCNFLAGMYDGDGCVTSAGIVYTTTSKELSKQLHILLLNLGFHPRRQFRSKELLFESNKNRILPTGKTQQIFHDAYNIVITQSEGELFRKLIPIKIKRKKENLNNIISLNKQDNFRHLTIPASKLKEKILYICKEHNKTKAWFRAQGLRLDKVFDNNPSRKITQRWLRRFKQILVENSIFNKEYDTFFDEFLNYECMWDPIISIERGSAVTYDFTVPNTHTFLQNGIIGSNSGGSCIIGSTPLGAVGQFYELYQNAPLNGFNSIKLDWFCHPERDEEWYEQTKRSMSPKKFSREYLCSFLLSGDTVVDGEDIIRHEKSVRDPIEELGPERNVWVWKPYVPSHRYLASSDVARGDGEDYSTFVVIDADTLEIVAEYKGKIKVNKFAELLAYIGYQYGTCLVVVENNTFGLAVLVKLIELKYPIIYGEERGGKILSDGFVNWDLDDAIPGFRTDMSSRVLSVDKLEESFRLDKVITYSKRMIDELRNFIYENGKPQARKGANDDLVIALSIGLFVCSYVFGTRDSDIETTKHLLENIRRTEYAINYKTTQEGGFKSEDNIYRENPYDPYSAVYKNNVVDFRWVLGQRKAPEKIENKGIEFIGILRK